MDRSFLLQKDVIEASRDFVCIRLATYEDKEEAAYLARVFSGPLGTLENTVFAMLAPDARSYLTRTGRGPRWAFADAADMAASMRRFSARFEPSGKRSALPALKDFRLSLNVAACDNLPLVVAVGESAADRQAWNEKLAELAWTSEMLGRCAYAPSCPPQELKKAKIPAASGLYVIAPDPFGLTGRILARLESRDDPNLVKSLRTALDRFVPPTKTTPAHLDEGHRRGVYWETVVPVTDPQARTAGP